jgi:hypothetical protein
MSRVKSYHTIGAISRVLRFRHIESHIGISGGFKQKQAS